MRIKLLSDVHLEFGDFDPGTGDVLVLAGDICLARDIKDKSYLFDTFSEFFEKCSQGYNKVFYILGNHEHYDFQFDKTAEVIRDILPSNVTLLDNSSEFYEGVHFVGATLWADFNGGDNLMMEIASECMSDYHVIGLNATTPLIPLDTLIEHDKTVHWLGQCLPTLRGKKVVITHHAPTRQSLDINYNKTLDGAYASDLTSLIHKEQPDYWFHGHIHASNDYEVGQTRVISNPRGYADHGLNPNFNPGLEIEL